MSGLSELISLKIQSFQRGPHKVSRYTKPAREYVSRPGSILIVFADGQRFLLDGIGYCCASCWIEHVDGIDPIGATITGVIDNGWSVMEDYTEEVDEKGLYALETDRGVIQIDMRLSHNGYYGGELEAWRVNQDCQIIAKQTAADERDTLVRKTPKFTIQNTTLDIPSTNLKTGINL